jgi:uncharacterized protein YjiK
MKILLSLFFISVASWSYTGCLNDSSGETSKDHKNKDKTENVYQTTVPGPSGLAFSMSKDALYAVSDKDGRIYKISYAGEVIEKLPFQGKDLEGIDVDKNNGEIWVVEERKKHIVHLSSKGELIDRITDVHIDTKSNSGLEGIAKNGDTLYLLIEKDPGWLIKYNIRSKNWDKCKLNFAEDFSGIDYDTTDNTLWIVSDESKTLNHCNLDGTLIKSQKIDIIQAEGVAVDRRTNTAWIISDSSHRLYRITIII